MNDAADRALAAEKPAKETARLWVFSPDVDPTSAAFDTPAVPEGQARHDGRRDQPDAARRDGAQPGASWCSARTWPTRRREEALSAVPGKGGVFKVTHGLQRAFGAARVFNSPLAEANIIGRAVGMAIRGIKPVVEIQFFDYIWPAMMQLRDEMAMMRYRSGNNFSCPMVVRVADRRLPARRRARTTASRARASSRTARASGSCSRRTRIDAAGLLRTAIRCDDPVLFLEHKHLYRQTYNKGAYPGPDFMIPFGRGSLVARRDATSWS